MSENEFSGVDIAREGGDFTVIEPHECPECGGQKWLMGYEKTGEFINECIECGYIFFP